MRITIADAIDMAEWLYEQQNGGATAPLLAVPESQCGRGKGCWEDAGYELTPFQNECDTLMRERPGGSLGRWNSSRKTPRRAGR